LHLAPAPALIAVFLSGCAALVYQVVWQRLLVIFSGADIYSVTIIVAAYMGGLGAGALAGGRVADRIGPRGSLWAFVAAELLVGGFGLISKPLYYDLLYVRFPYLSATPAIAAVVLFGSLLWPTFLMGLSLPLLARALTRDLDAIGGVVGSLYGWNTLGAASGAFVATWLLLPRFGLEGSLWIGAAVTFAGAAAAALLALGRTVRNGATAVIDRTDQVETSPFGGERRPWRWWLLIYGLSGFVALGLEIAWFRVLGVMLKSSTFTFGSLLAVYLAGLGLGAAFAARRVARSGRPGMTFLLLQYGLTLYAAFSTTALIALLGSGHPTRIVRYLGEYDPMHVAAAIFELREFVLGHADASSRLVDFSILYFALPMALVGPATFVMGASFPFLQRATQSDFPRLGRKLGVLLAANIAGGVLGAALVGWVMLPGVGTAGTLKALSGLGVLLALPLGNALWPARPGMARAAALTAIVATGAGIWMMPGDDTLWARLHSAPPAQVMSAEDGGGVSVLKSEASGFQGAVGVYVNGLGQSWIPYGEIHTALGALPAFIHPAPADVLIIGLGSGDTAFAAAGRREVQRLRCVEIIGAQLETLRRLARIRPYPGLLALLSDRRVEHVVGDGRAYLLHAGRAFDIVEADALRPTSAYAGNLYSREYFELVQRHLKPGGLAVTWAPTERVRHTFVSVFPHVLAFGDIYVGSDTPIPFDPNMVAARVAAMRSYYDAAGLDINAVLRPYIRSRPRAYGPADRRAVTDLNTDTFPRDEFELPF
jgi:spermidine synthase